MASAGSTTVTSSTSIYEDAKGCSSFLVRCESDSTVAAEVQVRGLHESDDWFLIPIGKEYIFRLNHQGIRKVLARGVSGSASIGYGVVANTQPE